MKTEEQKKNEAQIKQYELFCMQFAWSNTFQLENYAQKFVLTLGT